MAVIRHSWPKPDIRSGSFVYDVVLPTLPDWKPNDSELRTMTSVFWKIKDIGSLFERLDVDRKIASEIFSNNKFKSQQIEQIAGADDKVTLYRVDDYIDISCGPMIANTSMIGRANVTAVYKLNSAIENLYRFQAIALPAQLPITHYTYKVLTKRAKYLNRLNFPDK